MTKPGTSSTGLGKADLKQAMTTTKYRGLSTALRSGRDDVGLRASGGGFGDSSKTQIPFGNDKQRRAHLRGNRYGEGLIKFLNHPSGAKPRDRVATCGVAEGVSFQTRT
jgi:hypothetical protein